MTKPAYEQAYDKLLAIGLDALSKIETEESVQPFIDTMTAQVKRDREEVNEFYVGEFIQLLKEAAWEQRQAEILACELIVEEAKDEGKAASTELTERLTEARLSGDRQAQHEIWREREVRLAQVQSRVDDATAQLRTVGIRRRACDALAKALGI